MDQPIRVVCGIIIRETAILAALRSPGQSQGGLWEFPGGKIHEGESSEQALIRELQEELSITVRVGKALTPNLHRYPNVVIKLIPFLCEIESGTPFAHEHTEFKWISIAQTEGLSWAPADIPIVNQLRNLLQ